MAWYRNYYKCARCGRRWTDEWSRMCDDDCRRCGARHMSPYNSDDLTKVIVPDGDEFVVLRSPKSAGHYADYRVWRRFATRAKAQEYLKGC